MQKLLISSCYILLLTQFSCSENITGTLINPRDYLNTNGMSNDFSTQLAFRGNLPSALLTKNNKTYYLALPSNQFEKFINLPLKIKGQVLTNPQLLYPEEMWVKRGKRWVKTSIP